jgi:hypothetical protein
MSVPPTNTGGRMTMSGASREPVMIPECLPSLSLSRERRVWRSLYFALRAARRLQRLVRRLV